MIGITNFNNLIICDGFGARVALLLFVLVIVKGSSDSEFDFLGAAIKWKLNDNIHNNLEMLSQMMNSVSEDDFLSCSCCCSDDGKLR